MNNLLISLAPSVVVLVILAFLLFKSNTSTENNKKYYLIGILVSIASIVLTIYFSQS